MSRFVFTLTLPDATGASRMVVHFISAFRRRGHDVTLVHGPPPRDERSILQELERLGVELVAEPGLAFPASPLLPRRLARTFAARDPAAVVGVQQRDRAVAMQAAHRAGLPGFVSCQNTHVFWGRWPLNRLKERYYARAMRRYPRLVVCSSPLVRDEMIRRFGLAEGRTVYLPNAIDLSTVREPDDRERERLRAELGVDPAETMLVNVGRINRQKGQDLLVEAFARIRPKERAVKLVLVGGVSHDAQYRQMLRYHDDLRATVARLGLEREVVFAGWRDDVPALLQAADAYVHSARWEGFGIASFEGMAAGRPTIWTDCWGRPEGFADDVHGWLVPTEDIGALAAAMETLLGLPPDRRREVGEAGRAYVAAHYDSRRISDRFVDLLETALA